MNIRLKKPEEKLPEDYKVVIIRYRKKDWKEGDLPYELGSAYRYNNEWWVNNYDPTHFNVMYEVTGWAHYQYTFEKPFPNG